MKGQTIFQLLTLLQQETDEQHRMSQQMIADRMHARFGVKVNRRTLKGYLDDPEKTSEVLRHGKWYITGDIARMNRNGFITITGRMSRFSKIAGEMVPHELVEKEINDLLRPDDRLFAVCGGSDTRKGERLLVFYTDPERLVPAEVVRELNKLPIPKLWIPKEDSFVQIAELPVLGSGKLDLAKLAEMAQNFCATGDPLTPPAAKEDDAQG